MFTVALDASGDESTPVLTVAGFVSSVTDWEEFSDEWERRLKRDGIEYFRAVEWAHGNEQFEGWLQKEEERKQIAADLMDILRRHAYRQFGCAVINKAFQQIDVALRKEFLLCAHSLAGRTCAKLLRDWAISERIE